MALCIFIVIFLQAVAHTVAFAQNHVLALSETEKDFIRTHPVIRVGIDPLFAPFESLDNLGNYVGIAPDYLALVSAKTGLSFEPAKGISYAEAQEKVLAHEIDLLPTLGWTPERESKFLLTELYYELKLALVVREENPVKSVSDSYGQPIAVQQETSNASFASDAPWSCVRTYKSEKDALLAVADGREAVMLGYLPTVLYSIRDLGLSNLRFITIDPGDDSGWHMGVRDDWPELRSILNKAFAAITLAERAEIQNRWIRVTDGGERQKLMRAAGAIVAILCVMLAFAFLHTHNQRKKTARHRQNELLLQETVRQRTEELRNQTRLAVEASSAKSAFLARMSHEIRTPLNAVIVLSEMLSTRDLPADALEEACNIKQAGNALLAIINEILDFSKIEAGKMEIVETDYALRSLLSDVESMIRPRLAGKPVDFVTAVDEDLPDMLRGDMTRVSQILLNLLSNAAKFTDEGTITLTVSGSRQEDGKITLSFEVADTGAGIKEEDMGKLFDSFSQVDPQKNRYIQGTGLGLAISRSLCQMMGGEISIRSAYGSGSAFTAVIPQTVLDGRHSSLHTDKGETALPNRGKRLIGFTAPAANILAVDDTQVNLKILKALLQPYKVNFDVCASGEEAVALAKRNPYDLIFMDHMMPGMDGVEATAAIRRQEGGKSVPIVALTASAISGMREMFLENGFSDYLSKPIDIARLDEIVATWIKEGLKVKAGD
ncbi:MAG: transporter substrate-binding domain-containing protein [Synergistaceae bacterium]|jgi:signal transduction histidine kinase/CheY-like chemotaxis protein|nr:transporter substrate-binding domain-containing protein [Synergistaceae bacterium]